jgi:hypothetical protein
VIEAGDADESELMKRVLLPKDHDDHMPPKEKPQLNENDIAILHWWISSGADFNKKVKDLDQPEKIKPALLALQTGNIAEEAVASLVPEEEVEPAESSVVKKLIEIGAVVIPVARNSNYLSVNFVTATGVGEEEFKLLEPLKEQLVWLKAGNLRVTDSAALTIGKLANLRRLHLENTGITDWGLGQLANLKALQYLNITGNNITSQGLQKLRTLPALQQVYIYRTAINSSEMTRLKEYFPRTYIDTGGYTVATLVSDTTEVKQKNNTN